MKDLKLYAPGLLGYAALLGALAALLHWHIGPNDLELGALAFVLGALVPSAAVQNSLPTAVVTPVAMVEAAAEKVVEQVATKVAPPAADSTSPVVVPEILKPSPPRPDSK